MTLRKTKCCPSCKKLGYAWKPSLRDTSSCVIASATPPASDTRRITLPVGPPKMITPSEFQEPPKTGSGASHKVCGVPPETPIFLSFPAHPNAMKRLSGDQNG